MAFFDRLKSKGKGSKNVEPKNKSTARKGRNDHLKRGKKGDNLYTKLPDTRKETVNRILETLAFEDDMVSRDNAIKVKGTTPVQDNGPDEKRRDNRYVCLVNDFAHVNLALKDASQKVRVYDLKVKDCTPNGLGLVIASKDANLIESIAIGDQLKNVTFFSAWKVTNIDGVITHKTRRNKDTYIIGLKSDAPLEKYRPSY